MGQVERAWHKETEIMFEACGICVRSLEEMCDVFILMNGILGYE